MELIKKINSMLKKPVLFLTVASVLIAFGMVRCAGEVDAQAQTTIEISK